MSIWDQVRERLEENGWTKGYRQAPCGRVCLLGAFEDEEPAEYYLEEMEAVVRAIEENPVFEARLHDKDPYNLCVPAKIPEEPWFCKAAGFNNHPDTTLDDVLTVVNRAEEIFC